MRVSNDVVQPDDSSTRDSLLVGVRHIRRDPLLIHPLVGVGLALVVFGFSESVTFAVVDAFERPAAYVGVIVMVQGIGAVAGGLVAAPLIKRISEPAAIVMSLLLFAISTTTIALAPALWVVLIAVVPTGVGLPLTIIALNTLLQRRTPAPIIGRVSAAFDTVLGGPQTLSVALGAGLVLILSYHAIYVVMALSCLVAAGYVHAMAIRKPGRSQKGIDPAIETGVSSRNR